MTSRTLIQMVLVSATVFTIGACRGTLSEKPPVYVNPSMDFQEMFEPQAANDFFEDGRAMRPPVAGTIARGMLEEDDAYYRGKNEDGSYISANALDLTPEIMKRGQQRYEIFCAVCHGDAGDGQGIIMTGDYGFVPAPSYHTDSLRVKPDGYFYEVISNGVRTMPGYGSQIPIRDRWAIVAYLRALQRSQWADAADVPAAER